MGRQNCWNKSWSYCSKTRQNAKKRKKLKQANHRYNRRVLGRALETVHVAVNGWDVS